MIQQGTAHQACHSLAQHAMTWDCMTQHGMALHGMMQHGTAQHDVAQQGTAWRRPPHLGMALHSTAQHDLIKCVCNPNLHSADLITAASNFPPAIISPKAATLSAVSVAEHSCLPLFLQGFCRSPLSRVTDHRQSKLMKESMAAHIHDCCCKFMAHCPFCSGNQSSCYSQHM